MLAYSHPSSLLASADPELLARWKPVLEATGARVEVCLSAEPALSALSSPQAIELAVLDANLPEAEWADFLARARSAVNARRVPIVVVAQEGNPGWADRLAEGIIDDLMPVSTPDSFLRARLDAVLRNRKMAMELEMMREAAVLTAQVDRLTGLYNRETILSMLFRETDRVQRMKSSLCMILLDIDDFGHWNERLGAEACDDLLNQIASRSARLLRSYDLLGRVGADEFLVGLPGCSEVNAVLLAERMRYEVFATPFQVNQEAIRLSACFGITSSQGRSPLVVLREAELALHCAKEAGPETIHCAGAGLQAQAAPFAFLPPTTTEQLFDW